MYIQIKDLSTISEIVELIKKEIDININLVKENKFNIEVQKHFFYLTNCLNLANNIKDIDKLKKAIKEYKEDYFTVLKKYKC